MKRFMQNFAMSFLLFVVIVVTGCASLSYEDAMGIDDFYGTWNGSTLIEASALGNLALTQKLIKSGAYIDAKDDSGETALFKTIRSLFHVDEDENTERLLNDKFNCASYLINVGADVNQKDKNGFTAIMIALIVEENSNLLLEEYREKIVSLLIQHGASVNEKVENEKYKNFNLLECAEYHGNENIVRLLKDAGAK